MTQAKESAPVHKTTAVKATEAAKEIPGLIKRYYARAQERALAGDPVAYCMVLTVPQEILLAMGIVGSYTEHYATVCAAKRANMSFLERAEGDGYPIYTCSYARTWLGYAALMGEAGAIPEGSPWGGLPKPTMILGRGSCEAGYKGYQALARYQRVPVFIYDQKSPEVRAAPDLAYEDPEVEKRYIEHEKGQLRSLVAFLEKHTGRKLRWDAVSEAMVKNHEARALWYDIYQLRKAVPCPVPVGDTASCMFPLYYMMGTQEGLDFYRKLHDEVALRVANKIGVIPDEKYRLLWAGIPQWHNLGFFNAVETAGAVFVVDTQPYRDAFVEVDMSNPLEAIAKRNFCNTAINAKRARFHGVGDSRAGLILELAKSHQVDGAVLHLPVSCRSISIGQLHVSKMLKQHLGIPALRLESDITDARAFSEVQTQEQVDAFLVAVDTYKRQR